MAHRTSTGRSARNVVNCDLELRPLMNVFIVLIPMLLMSAVFMEIRVIEMSQPGAESASAARPAAAPLELALRVRGDTYVVTGNGIPAMTFARHFAAGRADTLDHATSTQLAAVLAQIVAGHPDNKEIHIVAEARTRYQEIVSLMDLARAAGLPEAVLVGSVAEGA